jgi:hypothetical protein
MGVHTFNLLRVSSTSIMGVNLLAGRRLVERDEAVQEVRACLVVIGSSGVIREVVTHR